MGEILKELPAVILRGSVLLPGVVSHFDISTQRSIHAVEAAMNDDNHIFLVRPSMPNRKMSMLPVWLRRSSRL